jgi:positive regulator of sigma E activity
MTFSLSFLRKILRSTCHASSYNKLLIAESRSWSLVLNYSLAGKIGLSRFRQFMQVRAETEERTFLSSSQPIYIIHKFTLFCETLFTIFVLGFLKVLRIVQYVNIRSNKFCFIKVYCIC